MFGKSLYKKLAEDFSFLEKQGFHYMQDIYDQVGSSILFKSNRYFLEIGYDSWVHKMFVILYDTSRKRHFFTEEGRNWAEKVDPQENWGICQFTDILNNVVLIGKSYKEQVDQVKTIVLEHIKRLSETM